MWKKVGFQFKLADYGCQEREMLHKHTSRLTMYYKGEDPNFTIPSSQSRHHYRVPIRQSLPENLEVEVWIRHEDHWVNTQVIDISAGGICVVIPFDDKVNQYVTKNTYDIYLRLGCDSYYVEGIIVYLSEANFSKKRREYLAKVSSKVHPDDINKRAEEIVQKHYDELNYEAIGIGKRKKWKVS